VTTTILTPDATKTGYHIEGSGIFTLADPPLVSNSAVLRGAAFQFDLAQTEQPIVSALTLDLTCTILGGDCVDGFRPAITILMSGDSTDTPFIGTEAIAGRHIPHSGDYVTADISLGAAVPSWPNWTFMGTVSSATPVAFPISIPLGVVGDFNFSAQEGSFRPVWQSGGFRGRIAVAIHINATGLGLNRVDSASLTMTWEPFFQGLIGGPHGGRHRFVRDARFGMPALNTELIRDGDQPSLWVRPGDSDPEDEPRRYRPRPGEGTVDDDINT